MSVESIARVLNHSKAKGTDKLILVGIANHDGDGGAWPSIATLMRYANVAERTVQDSITRLIEMGELKVTQNAGGTQRTRADRRTNLYEITVDDGVRSTAPREADGVRSDDRTGCGPPHPNHPVTTQVSNRPPSSPYDDVRGWDAFWALYPKKESKLDAVRAWKKIKISDHDAVMNALRAQLQTGQALGGDRDPQFIPLAATWLNKGRWTDPLRQVPKTALNRNAPMQDRMAAALNLLNGPSTQKAIES